MSPLSGVTVAILAGGLGTRLRGAVPDRPKALAVVGGRPFLYHVLDQVASFGARRVVLCTGFEGDRIESEIGFRYRDVDIAYSREPGPRGTGGALRLALPSLGSDPVLAMNGDSLCAADLGGFLDAHRSSGAPVSLLLARVPDASRFGAVELAPDGSVSRFLEKGGAAGEGWINAGVYLFRKALLESIPEGRALSLEREMFPAWAGSGMRGHRTDAPFIDIGIPESWREAGAFLEALPGFDRIPPKE